MGGAGSLEGGVEVDRVRIGLGAPAIEHRGQVAAAAEPVFAGDDHARVHVRGWYIRIARMDDNRDAGAPELGAGFGVRHLPGELFGEGAVDDRDVDAGLFEDAAVEQADLAAAAVGARPWFDLELGFLVLCTIGPKRYRSSNRGVFAFDGLQLSAEVVADLPEPRGGLQLVGVDVAGEGHVSVSERPVWRRASPKIRLAATATLRDRRSGSMG